MLFIAVNFHRVSRMRFVCRSCRLFYR